MTGEIAIGGVLVPALLVLALAALVVTIALASLLNRAGFYRMVAWRPLVDVTLYMLVLGLLVMVTARYGIDS